MSSGSAAHIIQERSSQVLTHDDDQKAWWRLVLVWRQCLGRWNGKGMTCRAFHFTSQRLCKEVHDRIYDWWPYYQEGQTCLHIGHLVPLERSNIAMLLGSSGVVRSSKNPLKMIVKMLTYMNLVLFTWCCWHICKEEGVGVDVDQLGKAGKVFRCSPELGWILEWNTDLIHCVLDQIFSWVV